MTMLAAVNEHNHIATLADYEARIYLYKEQIGTGYIGIGRTLLEAKAADVVPHGEWETWVTRTTGLNPRQAQSCMQAALEIKDGSALARLEMSKALLVLSSGLDEEAQEKIAQQAADEGATVKQLRKEIREKQEQADELARMAREYSEDADKHCQRANEAEAAAHGMESALREVTQENESLRSQLETVQEYVADQRTQAANAARQEAVAAAKQEIDELRADLDAAEAREERRAAELETLRREHQQRAMDDARGLTTSTLSGFDLAAAVRAFIGSAGVLPQMGPTLRSASPAERETIRQNIDTVASWVDGARQALGIYTVTDGTFVVE